MFVQILSSKKSLRNSFSYPANYKVELDASSSQETQVAKKSEWSTN